MAMRKRGIPVGYLTFLHAALVACGCSGVSSDIAPEQVPKVTLTLKTEEGKIGVYSSTTLWEFALTVDNRFATDYETSGEFVVYVQEQGAKDWGGAAVYQGQLPAGEKVGQANSRLGCGSLIHIDESDHLIASVTGGQAFIFDDQPNTLLSWPVSIKANTKTELKTKVLSPWLPPVKDGIWVATPQFRAKSGKQLPFRYWLAVGKEPTSSQSQPISHAEIIPIDEAALLKIARAPDRVMVLRRAALAWLANCAPIHNADDLVAITYDPSLPRIVRETATRGLIWAQAPGAEQELRGILLTKSQPPPEEVLLAAVYALQRADTPEAKRILSEVAKCDLTQKVKEAAMQDQ